MKGKNQGIHLYTTFNRCPIINSLLYTALFCALPISLQLNHYQHQTTWITKINSWGRRKEATAVCTSQHATPMSQAIVFWWWKHFKDGNKRVVDNAWNERPSTVVTDDNGYLGSKLWKAFTMRIQLKLTYGMLFRKIKKKRLEFLMEQWFMLQDNAWPHTALWRLRC
jgi:hypothetical protein